MRSLFVISLPRSLSSLTYHAARAALGLNEPVWVSDGEVLNSDRYSMNGDPRYQGARKYTRPSEEPRLAASLCAFLDQLVRREGFAYKDVVQPFVVGDWLAREGRELAVLRIRRPLVDVALSMLERRWLYPAKPPYERGLDVAMLRGLAEAQASLDAVPAVDVEYDDLVSDESALRAALGKLVPDRDFAEVRYLDPQFVQYRENRLSRRATEPYQYLRSRLEEVCGGMA